jgi:hypothetical protein
VSQQPSPCSFEPWLRCASPPHIQPQKRIYFCYTMFPHTPPSASADGYQHISIVRRSLRGSGYMRGWLGGLGRVPNTICDCSEPLNANLYLVSTVAIVYVLGQVTQKRALRTYNGLKAHQLVRIRSSRSEECANAANIGITSISCYHHNSRTTATLLSSLMHHYDQRSIRA